VNEILAAVAGTLGAAYVALEAFRSTSHGQNPWTLDGFVSVLLIALHVKHIAEQTNSSIGSVYRSPEVQAAVYKAKLDNPTQRGYVQSLADKAGMAIDDYVRTVVQTSRHMRGLAADFTPRAMSVPAAAVAIHDLALSGHVGRVKLVLQEGDHVHVEWYGAGEQASPVKLGSV
jgi:hypothetical protein